MKTNTTICLKNKICYQNLCKFSNIHSFGLYYFIYNAVFYTRTALDIFYLYTIENLHSFHWCGLLLGLFFKFIVYVCFFFTYCFCITQLWVWIIIIIKKKEVSSRINKYISSYNLFFVSSYVFFDVTSYCFYSF